MTIFLLCLLFWFWVFGAFMCAAYASETLRVVKVIDAVIVATWPVAVPLMIAVEVWREIHATRR